VTERDYVALLQEALNRLDDAERWLRRSYRLCEGMEVEGSLEEEDFDRLETLTSRFARVSDMLLQKVFRSIDQLELEGGGTLLDALHRAEKRGLIDSVDQFRLIRELRNEIAHEYALDELRPLFKSVLEQTPVLFSMIDKVKAYCSKYTEESP
jgi:hypothetical protein